MKRLKQFSKIKPCYYCGAGAPITKEHVPPATMFTGFGCDSITVPSCPLHNNNKDYRDQAIVMWLLLAVQQMEANGFSIPDNVRLAFKNAQNHFGQAKRDISLRPLLSNISEDLNYEMAYLYETKERKIIIPWMRQLTAGLVWSVMGEWILENDFKNAWVYSPDFFSGPTPLQPIEFLHKVVKNQSSKFFFDSLVWKTGWPSGNNNYPSEIFFFELSFIDNTEQWDGRNVIFKYRFYSIMTWYVWFTASKETKRQLALAVNH